MGRTGFSAGVRSSSPFASSKRKMGAGGSKSFHPDRDICDLTGKVVVVTGGNNGLGKETVLRLAKHNPKKIFLCSRNSCKGEAAMSEIKAVVPEANIEVLVLDLSSLASVAAAANEVKSKTDRLDILVNNAGIMAHPPKMTEDGYEITWATDYLGHALLTKLLLPLLSTTSQEPDADPRIVNVSSLGHKTIPACGIDFDDTSLPNCSIWTRYGQAKLANILHARALAKRYPKVTSTSLHPGAVTTNLADTFMSDFPILSKVARKTVPYFISTPEQGTKTQLWLATVPKEEIVNGAFYMPMAKLDEGGKFACDDDLADRLWEWTEKEFEKHGY